MSEEVMLKEKLRLLESDRKAYFETTQQQLKQNKDLIKSLRKENKELKSTLASASKGSFHEREMHLLDGKIYQTTKELDRMRGVAQDKKRILVRIKEELRDVHVESQPLLTEQSYMTRKIRMLENRLDKSLIKFNEAQSIKKTYDQIVKRLREERVGFDNQLAAIERTLKAKDHDYQELLNMSHDANHAKEVAKAELQNFTQVYEEERRRKDKELAERKAYVQAKIDQTQKLERKEKQRRQQEADEGRQKVEDEGSKRIAMGAGASGRGGEGRSVEEEERLSQYEAAFRQIKEATGVSDVQEVIQKFVTQEETHRSLLSMTKDAQGRIDQLNAEKAELQAKVEELRYSGSGQLGSRRVVEEFEAHLLEAQNQGKRNAENYERLAKILINVKAGVEHLADKLSVFRPDLQAPTMSDESVMEVLKLCEHKLQGLADEAVPNDGPDDQLMITNVDLPTHNRRIRLPTEEEEDGGDVEGELGDDHDDDAVLKRDQVKKISANSIQRETKKLKRRRNKDKQL